MVSTCSSLCDRKLKIPIIYTVVAGPPMKRGGQPRTERSALSFLVTLLC